MIVSLDAVNAGHNKTLSVWPFQRETKATANSLSQFI